MAWFEVKSPKRGAKLRLDASFFVIGRGERIPIFHDDPSISREHAAIVIKKTGVRVRDLGSRNGVLLNGAPMERYAEADLKPGDSLRVGATTLVLREGEPPEAPKETHAVEVPAAATAAPPTTDEDGKVSIGDAQTGVKLNVTEESVEDLSKLEAREAPPPPSSSSSDEEDDAEPSPQLE